MNLWVDKYRPNDLSKLDYHKQQADNLQNLIEEDDFPHLLFYGPNGSGKKTRMMCLLKELYGPGVENLKSGYMDFATPSGKKLEIMTVSSNYHIEVNPSDVGIYDRVVIMDLIKNVAQNQKLDINGQKQFKVVILTNVDELTKDAQHALRRTMEKYISNCRLLMSANSVSRIIPAIKSRCLTIRVPAPTVEEISSLLINICKKEGFELPLELSQQIAIKSERNLRRAILMCEACKVEKYPFEKNQKISEPDWVGCIQEIAKKLTREQSIKTLSSVREDLYDLLGHAIPCDLILKNLVNELIKSCDSELIPEVVESAAFYENRLNQGSKDVIHLEAFVSKYIFLYKKFLGEIGDIF